MNTMNRLPKIKTPLLALPVLCVMMLPHAAQAQVSFGASGLSGEASNNPTTLQFGPDDRLYVGQKDGTIYAYNVERTGEDDYQVIETEQIDLVKTGVPNYNDDGTVNGSSNRQVTGLLVVGSFSNPVLYVSSSDPRIGAGGGGNDLGLDTNSGVITRLTCSGGMDANNECLQWDKIDLIRGLPRSEENHATNGMQLDTNTNQLFIAQGGHANAGAPSNNFAFTTEYALSAALLVADLNVLESLPTQTDAAGVEYKYNLPTVGNVSQAELASNDNDHPAPFGGDDGLNQAMLDPNGPVQIFASGFRNLYDIVLTQSGRIYGVDNGANGGWGGFPEYEESYDCTNNYISGEPGSTGSGVDPATYPPSVTLHDGLNGTVPSDGAADAKVNNKNGLHLVTQGYYGGHPAPIRGNPAGAGIYKDGVFFGPGNANLPANWPPVPLASANPVECDFQNSGVDDGSLANFGPSTNGIAEYTASNFSGALQGSLLAAGFGGSIYQVDLNAAGNVAINCPANPATNCNDALFSGFGSQPLDVVALSDNDLFPGTVWAVTYGANNITVFEPDDFNGTNPNNCTGVDDAALDEDTDGFDNADEIDNGTDPCSGGSKPSDRDGDLTSDLNDPDDDNDGLADDVDHFQLDANNGTATSLPVIRELFSDVGAPTSFFGMGFSGLMANGDDYLTLIDDVDDANGGARQLIAGGTAGLFTDTEIGEGDAYQGGNTQKNSFQFGIDVDSATPPFTIKARILGDFLGVMPANFASQGIYIGTGDQDNYIKFVVNANGGAGGLELLSEVGGTASGSTTGVTGILTEVFIDLYLSIDPSTGDVTAAYELQSDPGIVVTLGTVTASGDVLAAMQGSYTTGGSPSALAVGTIATSTGPAAVFDATWDFIYITQDAPASLAVNPVALDFGAVTIGSTSVPQAVALTHTGGALSAPLTVSAVNFTGADAGEFSSNFAGPVVLSPGDTQDIGITLSPTSAATKTATAQIVHDGTGVSPQIVTLDGAGVEAPTVELCINAGGPQYVSTGSGLTFVADSTNYYDNGTVYTNVAAIADTTDDTLFHTERYDANLSYSIPVPGPGDYTVALYFAELYFGAPGGGAGGGLGSRVFDILLEGNVVETNYDIFADVGALAAVTKTYPVTITDSEIDIDFPATVNNGKISAICIIGGTGGGNQPPTVQPIADQSSVEGEDIGNAGLSVVATDPEDSLSYAAIGLPPGISLEPTNGQFFGVVTAGASGSSPYNVTVSVDDGVNATVTTNFTWTVDIAPAISVSISSPTNNSTVSTNDPTLTWSTVGLPTDQGDHIHLYVDTNNFNLRISPLPLSGSAPLSFYTGRLLADGPHTIMLRPAGTGHVEYPGIETQINFTVAAGSIVSYRVNAGGPQLASGDGSAPAWSQDIGGAGSPTISPNLVAGSNYGIATHVVPIDLTDTSVAGGPAVEALFQKERWDDTTAPEMQWAFPVTPGSVVEVRLYLAETFDNAQSVDARVFDVAVEGTVPGVYDDIDLFAVAGADKAFVLPYQLTVADDMLNLEFLHGSSDNPALKGIEVVTLNTGVFTNPAAFVTVAAGSGLGASTYGAGSFKITNTGDVDITSVQFDLSSAILPDLVFDPLGTAGDNAALCLVPGTAIGAPGYVVPLDNCVDPYLLPHNGSDSDDGYDGAIVQFTDFNPGEQFTFAADTDPTSIKTDMSAGDAGSVSGLELAGSVITVSFADGSVLTSTLFEEGSLGGSNALVSNNAPMAPVISMTGITTPGLVSSASQTIDVSGPPNATITLLQVDGHLYIDAGQANPGYDIDPFEANSAVAKALYTTVLDVSGFASIPVTLLQTVVGGAPDGGINHFLAVVEGAGDQNSATSNVIVVEYDVNGGVNQPPVLTDPGNQVSVEGDAVSLQLVASAPEGDQTLTYSATNLPDGLTIDAATGLISGVIADGAMTAPGAFIEQGGIVVIEMESADNRPANWVLGPDENPTSPNINNPGSATGGQFLVWEAGQSLSTPGNGLMTYPVQINTPGTYQFQWRNQVGNGTIATEHNDTWVKIEGDAFYGQQGGGSVVCPKGYDPGQNDCTGGVPAGSGSAGWFKVYSSGANNWSWSTNTSDNNAHQIFARFDTTGVYNVLVSARSSSHVIDRMVLAKTDYSGNPQSTSLPESARDSGGGPGAADNSPYTVDITVTDDGTPVEQTATTLIWTVTETGTGSAGLTGTFSLAARSGGGGGGLAIPLSVNLYPVGSTALEYAFVPTADAAGTFTIAGMLPGNYQVAVKHASTLQVVATVVLTAGSNSANFGELPVGDVTDDNQVNILDLSAIVPAFDTSLGDAAYSATADLNGDGQVNILDLSATIPNFDTVGEEPTGSPAP